MHLNRLISISGAQVYIRVKPYNSFCVDSLFVGFEESSSISGIAPEQEEYMRAYLGHHGLDNATFTQLSRGKYPTRKFVPLPGQAYKGRIVELKQSSATASGADVALVEAHVGLAEPMIVQLERNRFSVYGHWMTKADLRHIVANGMWHSKMDNLACSIGRFCGSSGWLVGLVCLPANELLVSISESVYLEYSQAFDSDDNEAASNSTPKVAIAWLGDDDDRPMYLGQTSKINISQKMEESLWAFVRGKKMDEKMFRALVSYVLRRVFVSIQ
jgi:hypothetical protein